MKKIILTTIISMLFGTMFSGNPAGSANESDDFYQDPMKTSKYPNSDPIASADGSGGKYKKSHKHANGRKFASNHRHIKKAKKHNNKISEKSRNEATR